MSHHTENLATLIGSRICHDLVSPVGAISNGLELLQIAGNNSTPEIELVSESASDATAKIRLFRLAFGKTSEDQKIAGDELLTVIQAIEGPGRVTVTWAACGQSYARSTAQLVVLAALCAEHATATGGIIRIEENAGRWRIIAQADRLRTDSDLLAILAGAPPARPLDPAEVQFMLLRALLDKHDMQCVCRVTETSISLSF